MGYAILCDARMGDSVGIRVLGLVDRRRTKAQWWTSDEPSLLMRYDSERCARFVARRLRHNHPRVVPAEQAAKELLDQMVAIMETAGEFDDPSWDAHKFSAGG